jgi:hypothetical protein
MTVDENQTASTPRPGPSYPPPPSYSIPPLPTQASLPNGQPHVQAQQQPTVLPSSQPRNIPRYMLPIQYQAVVVKYLPSPYTLPTLHIYTNSPLYSGLPYLLQLQRPTPPRLYYNQVIPVTTHDGQRALIVDPQGVQSLANQGYRIETRRIDVNDPFARAVPNALVIVGPQRERRFGFGLTDFWGLFRQRLGQQIWLMCKLAFMVGIFSSQNASWRRIIMLCLVAAGIFCIEPPF